MPVDPAPARALHSDLLDRFKSLAAQSALTTSGLQRAAGTNAIELLADEDGKTVEDLLAELGLEDLWNVSKDEKTQVKELLTSATTALQESQQLENATGPRLAESDATDAHQAEDEPSEASTYHTMGSKEEAEPSEAEIDREADEYLTQVLEELKHKPRQTLSDKLSNSPEDPRFTEKTGSGSANPLNLPSAPMKEPDLPPSYSEATVDDDLASRFANLGLPSVPTTIKSASSKPAAQQSQKGYTDDEIDSWCIICNDDATLRCIGCDGDLYCTSCWLEGHKGDDAGYEERKHKAVQYNKGGGVKKQPARRTMMGA